MSAERWSEQPAKATPVDADEILVIDSSAPAVQKRATLSSVLANISAASKLLLVSNQADLETQFGTDIIITDTESWTVLILESFTLSKPFQIGSGSSLQVTGATINLNIDYTGTGSLFQNENPANPISLLNIGNLSFTGDGTNDIFDIVANFSIIIERSTLFNSFNSAGTWETGFFDIEFAALQGVNIGLVIINPGGGSIRGFSLNQGPTAPFVTFISIITNTTSQVTIEDCFSADGTAMLVFFDPNAPAGAKFTIQGTVGILDNLFAQGDDITIDSVADNGSGDTRFTTAIDHDVEIGQPVVLSAFAVETSYNQTAIVTAIPTATTFDCAITFTATDTGNLNVSSLTQKDVNVTGKNNVDTADSKTLAEALTTSTVDFVPSTVAFEPIVDTVPTPGDFLEDSTTEEFTVNTSTGQITYIGLIPRTADIKFNCSIVKSSGGGTATATITLFINNTLQSKSDRLVTDYSTAATIEITYKGGPFTINPGDTFELRMISDSVDPVTASLLSVVVRM